MKLEMITLLFFVRIKLFYIRLYSTLYSVPFLIFAMHMTFVWKHSSGFVLVEF